MFIHPLSRKYTFWLSNQNGFGNEKNFSSLQTFVGTFDNIEDFWGYYQHFVRPEQLPDGSQIYLFQNGIKPIWEDESNQGGGRFILRVKKSYSNKLWEDLLLSLIGDQFNYSGEICGIVCHPKKNLTQFSVWVKNIQQRDDVKQELLLWLQSILQLKIAKEIEFSLHPKI